MRIDKNRGMKYETMTLEEFNRRNKSNVPGLETVQFTGANTVTVYNIDTIPEAKHCKNHSGLIAEEDGVFHFIEECDCE